MPFAIIAKNTIVGEFSIVLICHVQIAGPCHACGKEQKWLGAGCMQCGYDTESGTSVPAPVTTKSSAVAYSLPNTSPSLSKINLSSCQECGSQISPLGTFCGNCGFNLEKTMM